MCEKVQFCKYNTNLVSSPSSCIKFSKCKRKIRTLLYPILRRKVLCGKSYIYIDAVGTGKRIKETILSHGYSVHDIQKGLGIISLQSIYKWFHGKNLPTLDNMFYLSKLLGVPIEDMIVCIEKEDVYAKNNN